MLKDFKSQEQINEMRKRLYDRGAVVENTKRHGLSDQKVDVSRDWSRPEDQMQKTPNTHDLRHSMQAEDIAKDEAGSVDADTEPEQTIAEAKPKRHYRSFVLIGSFLIFIFVAGLSSLFLYFGGNQISNENIAIVVQGPPFIGGGETLPFQVLVTNDNSVPIESATLIVKYPVGTRSIGDSSRNVFEERISIETIAPGEVKNIPVRVALFGEENAEKQIEATIEYRVDGSSGMFYKDANAFSVRISSSPLVLRVDTIEKVASGQLVDVTLTAISNASAPLNDVLVTASYPNGFAYESSSPEPVFGQNVWRIDELLPEEQVTIKLQGVITGLTEESLRIKYEVGQAAPDNQYMVDALLAIAEADFSIERPFVDVDVLIDGASGESILSQQDQALVSVLVKNTLDETIYDLIVEVIPEGNAIDEESIKSQHGFYDSNRNAVIWEVANNGSFNRVLPGDNRTLTFEVVPMRGALTTSSFELIVNVYARRVAETNAQETLIGTARTVAKYSSNVTVGRQLGRNVGRFGDSGPIPPKVAETTTYTVTLVAEAGANDVNDAVVETSLPVYVNWLDQYDAPGTVIYNSVSKQLQWEVGDIPLGERRELVFQVSIQPSTSQVGEVPTLINKQTIRVNDAFTGALLRNESEALTTELSGEMGFEFNNGEVVR